ncbi:MAG TPA: VirB8/TrbF family protein [Thermoanaerobaculia bacterium]|nr:VirB8/TrbF family protein [Thermoanaerobaculia bacterium]
MIGRLVRRDTPSPEPPAESPFLERPYFEGRRAFGGMFGDLARGKRNWQLIAFAQTALLGAVLLAYLRISLEARITPYVVEVDRHGRAMAFGPAEQLKKTDARIAIAELSLFVRDLRAVSSDVSAQREFLLRAYAHVTDDARSFLDAYFADPDHDPRLLGQRLSRTVEVTSILRLPDSDLWRIQWVERELPLAGPTRETAWEAVATVAVRPPKSIERIEANPIGLYVTHLDWVQIATPKGSPR